MFDAVRNNRRIVQIFLLLITLPFALWGVDSYMRDAGRGGDLATVGGVGISIGEFQAALRERQDQIRTQAPATPAAELDTPAIRQSVIDGLINEKLLAQHIKAARLNVPDQVLAQIVTSAPELQENGKFSKELYSRFVASQGMTEQGFEANLRKRMVNQQSLIAVAPSAWVGNVIHQRFTAAQLEQREVVSAPLEAASFVSKVKLADSAAKDFYEANRKRFELPEQVKVEFVALTKQQLGAQVIPSEKELKDWYEAHSASFRVSEERRASHILIALPKTASADAEKAAREKMDSIVAQVKKAPGTFAALAKQYSQDPGSAAKGGDLGWFGANAMVAEFNAAVSGLKEGQLSDVVRTEYGLHLILLTGIHPEHVKPFSEVKAEAIDGAKAEIVQRKFAEQSDVLKDLVYTQADSLKPAAEKLALEVRQAGWIAKNAPRTGPFAHPKLMEALFSSDVISAGHNTDAIEVAPGQVIAARVLEHKDATVRPFDEVKGDIEKKLIQDEALKLATQAAEQFMDRLRKGESVAELKWGASRTLARGGNQGISADAVKAVFQADVSKLPAFVGAASPDGKYEIFRINQVKPYQPNDKDERVGIIAQQYDRIVANEEMNAWLSELRRRYKVEVNAKLLEVKEH